MHDEKRGSRISGNGIAWRAVRTACVVVAAAAAFAAALAARQGPAATRSLDRFTMRVVASGLDGPWEVTYGPDQQLWVTERSGKRVARINPADGTKTVLLTIPDVSVTILQDGLLGLALHPDLLRGRGADFAYVAFTYDDAPGPEVVSRLAIRRYRYDERAHTLVEPLDVLEGLPAHTDHVGGRLIIGADSKLYLTIGDGGSNFGPNRCRVNRAQELPTDASVKARDWSLYEGKILRINLDGSIPGDNPVINGVRSHVFSYGHRNPLGLVAGSGGRIYESEHGPDTDDEVNLIEAGRNYGWPNVAGFRDDKTYAFSNWSASSPEPCASLPARGAVPPSVPTQKETEWSHPQFAPPLRTFFTFATADEVRQARGGTIAPGGLDVHRRGRGITGWNDSLLVLSMLRGVVYRLGLADDGRSVVEPPLEIFKTTNRYRDIAVHPDQRVFYLATDPTGQTSDASGARTQALANPGSILEFTYTAGAQ
ncbi:MAG TPA: glucose/sorbosone family PQQ-dependent dehydrogenase [Vicinamibacterales bacterium]|nr:glucose/sorbosone family PQQ-dependent dehydrogenase [Vicinamibacterales bacterium]